MITSDTIINFLKEAVENKQPIAPSVWLESAIKLNLLLGDEQEKLFKLQQEVATLKYDKITAGASVADAKAYTDTLDQFKEMSLQKAKIERINEFIRLAKIQSKILLDEMKGY